MSAGAATAAVAVTLALTFAQVHLRERSRIPLVDKLVAPAPVASPVPLKGAPAAEAALPSPVGAAGVAPERVARDVRGGWVGGVVAGGGRLPRAVVAVAVVVPVPVPVRRFRPRPRPRPVRR